MQVHTVKSTEVWILKYTQPLESKSEQKHPLHRYKGMHKYTVECFNKKLVTVNIRILGLAPAWLMMFG